MDPYEKKFAEMQKYIPFLEAMIERLKRVKDKSRESQLQKMQSLHGILSKTNGKKLTIEKLDRCEELLLKLHSRVDKGNASLSGTQSSKSSDEANANIRGNLESGATASPDMERDTDTSMRKLSKEETPASPSPPASPDQAAETKSHAKPIIIPTERSDGFTGTSLDDRPASPDECEMVTTLGARQPVIIPTEPMDVKSSFNPLRKSDCDSVSRVSKWNYPSGGSNKSGTGQSPGVWQSEQSGGLLSTSAVGSTTSKTCPDSRGRMLRHIPTVPTPSKGSSLIRKPVLVLDKKNSQGNSGSETDSPTTKWDSPLNSDSDSYIQRIIQTSPKAKELPGLAKLPTTLVSPPPVLTVPPLTTEDLAELLNDDLEAKNSKKSEAVRENSRKVVPDKNSEEVRRLEKESEGGRSSGSPSKDSKSSKSYTLTHEDIESDRRWEEEYKHIVKMPSRRVFSNPSGGTTSKHSESKFSSGGSGLTNQSERPTDPRKRPPSPLTKDRELSQPEPRYSDNYEKHPRPPRDFHPHNPLADHNQMNSAFPRIPEAEHPGNSFQNEDRALYQRRPYNPQNMHDQAPDLRRDKSDYYNRMMIQQERDKQQNINSRVPIHHSPGRGPDPCNQPQWGPNSNYPQGGQGPINQYPPQRPDMWSMKAGVNNGPIEQHMMPEQQYMRQGPYPPQPGNCRGPPMMSPQEMVHGPCMEPNFRDDIPNQSMIPPHLSQMVPPQHSPGIPPMMPPQGYQMGGQYRGFNPDNRQNVQQFDRQQEFPHPRQSWEPSVNRPPENLQYPRQASTGPWNRGRGQPSPGQGSSAQPPGASLIVNRDRSYDRDRRGPEPQRPFSRDPRTRTEPPPQQQHSPTGQANVRRDHVAPAPQNSNNPSIPSSNARRDPRFGKETSQPAVPRPKEHTAMAERGRRSSEGKVKHGSSKESRKSNEKRLQHNNNEKKTRRESEGEKSGDKVTKDVMQSPLESLYGVIDTAGKTGKGYGLQKFKIPKIKRPEPAPSPPRVVEDGTEESWDVQEEGSSQPEVIDIANERSAEVSSAEGSGQRREAEDKSVEVSSTTGEPPEESRSPKVIANENQGQKETSVQSSGDNETVDASPKGNEPPAKVKESDPASSEPTGDWLEAKFLEKINELLHSKKLKEQFKKLIVSDSSSGSEKEDEEAEPRKVTTKKKRRLIVSSDSSEEECLAERLGMIETSGKEKADGQKADSRVGESMNEDTEETKASEEVLNEDSWANDSTLDSNDTSRGTREPPSRKGRAPFRRKKREQKPKTGLAEEEQVVDESRTKPNESEEDKPKEQPTRTKTKRRNSLEMLQEDVREMFISDEVVTATGFRSCRLQKEDQQPLASSVENLSVSSSKKKGSTTSLDNIVAKGEANLEETTREQPATGARGRETRARTRRRPKARAKQRSVGKEGLTSDSETEDSSRVELSVQEDTAEVVKACDESSKLEESSKPEAETLRSKEDPEETPFLRRSERVGLRESLRDPRVVVQRADTGKIDSSKIIFDSSSDESFGIDVSELTAAVDISLHPEPQTSSTPTSKATAKAPTTTKKRKVKRRSKNAAKVIEDKNEVASADEVDSIASDLSRASSLTRGKKAAAAAGKPDTNEELLSDILTGLVDPKTPADVENEEGGALTTSGDPKGNARRRKKKKPSWQLGILKKRKRKNQSPVPSSVNDNENDDLARPPAELESSFEVPEAKVEPCEFSVVSKLDDPDAEVNEDEAVDPLTLPANPLKTDDEDAGPLLPNKVEPCSPLKSTSSATAREVNPDDLEEEKKALSELFDGNKSDCELSAESLAHLGVRKLMYYLWSTRKERFKCMFCHWIGKNIVHHYTLGHPGREVMISRLSVSESKRAVRQANLESQSSRSPKVAKKESRKFTCRFCAFTTEGSSSNALEAFYEHCTTHTGEYRFRCNCCPYQTVARSSMKTHYYRKACRNKYHGNLSLAICEDPVPDEDALHGYICTKCNFVQLKESNVRKHVATIHEKMANVEIVKINMSSFVDKEEEESRVWDESEEVEQEEEPKEEVDPLADAEPPAEALASKVNKVEGVEAEALKSSTGTGKSSEQSESEPTSSQEGPSDGPVAGNLSVFVCPPELENKEAEIQHERRKKMQEVVKNIGILKKSADKKGLSIIDKLKDKMTTTLDESLAEVEEDKEEETSSKAPAGLPVLVPESVTSLAAGETGSKESQQVQTPREKPEDVLETRVKDEPADSGARDVCQEEGTEDDKSEKKLKDPLAVLEEPSKDESSEGEEDSDRDTATEQPRSYESDSSDQSEGEIAADVNSLLEETFSINTVANAPMMTTIQRLAAKLQASQGEKSLPVGGSEGLEASDSTSEDQQPGKSIPKPPNAIPISCIQSFLNRRFAIVQEVAKAVYQTLDEPEDQPLPTSPPKKFIRLRRLSGDKLSMPGPAPETPVASPAEKSPSPGPEERGNEPPVETLDSNLDSEEEEACSFLRIENVISLAPGMDNDPNETMIKDIMKAVASTTPKSPVGVSVLRKASPNILKRPGPVTIRSPGLPVKPASPLQNVKLVKVVKGRTLLKQKSTTHHVFGSQLKNADVFADMLKPEKLRQFYKCMARSCSFTSDSLQSFEVHYRHHKDNVDRTQMLLTSYDFQRCPYCPETLTTWNAMTEHFRDKHAYCQFQCNYCFFRALAQSYVELHQLTVHQNSPPAVLLGAPETPPIEVIDRREFVIPFVCQHECGKSFYVPGAFLAHLRTKHGNSLSIFKCHLCPAPLFKAEQLVAHYKLHGIFKYQCLYCVFGSDQSSDVHFHLSASHYNRPPHILERTLQPRPVRDKDVIQQLVVLNVDEGYKCTELTLAPGQNAADVPKNKNWIQVDRNQSDGSTVGVVTLPIANIGMHRLFPYEKIEPVDTLKSPETSQPGTPVITKFRKVSPRKTPESLVLFEDSGTTRKVKVRDPLGLESPKKSSSLDGSPISSDSKRRNSVGTSSGSSNLHCGEEFVECNILEHPAFVNVADSLAAEGGDSLRDLGDRNDDSDIEILEDIQVTRSKNSSPKSLKSTVSVTSKEVTQGTKNEKAAVASSMDAEPVIVCSSTENSLDLNLNANSAPEEPEETLDRPLTLDDIRNTGFTGRNLYRCGYDSCEFGAENAVLLRTHIKECIFATETKNLNCVHCSKRFVKIGFLLEHFKLHGLKRFGCSMCNDRWTQPYQAMSHMKTKHRQTYSKLIPADPKNPSAEGLFIVEPIPSNGERTRGKKRGRAKSAEGEKMMDSQKIAYGPSEIDSLPRQPIYNQEVHCAVCSYTNKVRTNLIRHLQLHAKAETVPESGPVNPVPCLDKNERMFDKMVNLASSSHQNGRMGGTKPKDTPNDAESLPKFVPENKRYVCSVADCNYLSIDEAMLRTHLKALHPEEPYFRCPHCPAQVSGHEALNIPIDKMGVHLKMHDTRLYKCSHCNHHHYHRHVVERHLSDKHPEANPFIKVIREIENTDNSQQQSSNDGDEGSADPDGNHWKCNICDFKCIYKVDMVTHASSTHEEKSQFKCTLCSYKSNNKITFDQHVNAKHSTDPNADYTMVYQKIKGMGPRRAAEAGEGGSLDEPFDTTPLWRRDMPRIRHIRGILFEEDPSHAESPAKSSKRKSDADAAVKPPKTKVTKTVTESTEKDGESWNGTLLEDSSTNADDILADSDNITPTSARLDTSRLVRKFGPYGSPITQFWRCTICQCYKTKYKHDMRDHLYRDLNYFRYRCTLCGYSGVSKNSTLKHFMRNHDNRRPTAEEQEILPADEDLETWVQTLLKSQTAQMRGMVVDADGNIIGENKPKKANILVQRRSIPEAASKPSAASVKPAPLKESSTVVQSVDVAKVISDMKKSSVTGDISMQEIEDEDSNDNNALTIDTKDDGLEGETTEAPVTDDCEQLVDVENLYVCKHCDMKFERARGFKLHVQIRHLRRLFFLCPYCDNSSNSEKLIRKHLQMTHPNLPEQVNQNPVKNLPELTNEFWEKEYGLVTPEKPKKRKRAVEETGQDQLEKVSSPAHVCGTCGFRAINYFGLGVHMRVHTAAKSYKCAYCSFSASEKSELWQHSEKNHSHLEWRVGNGDPSSSDAVPDAGKKDSLSIERAAEEYEEYVAAEASASGSGPVETGSELSYVCFYCNYSRKTIDSLQEHWKSVHKNAAKGPGSNSTPFRYKEILPNPEKKIMRCGYCPKRGLAATIRLHSRKKHPSKTVKFIEIPAPADNWVCQWCGEFVDSEAKKKIHQNMFHSHLPPNFGRPQSNTTTSNQEQDSPTCPKCPFRTNSVAVMQKHVAKHVDSVRCKRCDKTFPDVTIAILHNTQAHPGEVSAIEGFTTNVEKLMSRINWRTGENTSRPTPETVPRSALENWRHCGVARKSTTKSLLKIQPKPSGVRAVARKSTNPLPRYPPGTRFSIDNLESTSAAASYYGLPREPVNLNKISTYITPGGGRQMKRNCTTLAQLIDIEPHVLVKDIKNDSSLSSLLTTD